MKTTPPNAPEIRGKLRAAWDRLTRRQFYEAGKIPRSLSSAEPSVANALAVWHLTSF